jgi:hypothetical protein
MPVAIKNPKRRPEADQHPNTVVKDTEADQHPKPVVKDPEVDQRATATRIEAELRRNANRHTSQRELKTRRRELRLTPSADDLIRCAMEVSGLTAGDLAYEGARKLLENHYRHNRQVRRLQRRHGSTRFKSGRT